MWQASTKFPVKIEILIGKSTTFSGFVCLFGFCSISCLLDGDSCYTKQTPPYRFLTPFSFQIKFFHLPTHSSKVQFSFCIGGPMQFLPLLDGGGLVQVLVLVLKHFSLHSPQFPQIVQPPATKIKGFKSNSWFSNGHVITRVVKIIFRNWSRLHDTA